MWGLIKDDLTDDFSLKVQKTAKDKYVQKFIFSISSKFCF